MKFKHPNLAFVSFVVIFVLVIVIGLLSLNRPDLRYSVTAEEALEALAENEDLMYPEDLAGIIEMEVEGYTVIDLRNPYEFIKGHITGAVNIPANSLLDKENLKLLDNFAKDSVQVVLYGRDQLEANGPWLILKQMGYDNLKVLMGGYGYFTTGPLDIYDMPEVPDYLVEEPKYDFYGIMEEMGSGEMMVTDDEQPQAVIPVRRKKTNVVEGGC